MKIDNRITLAIILFLVIMSGTIIIASNYIISSDYTSLEEVRAKDEMGKAITLINADFAGRERIVTDWAVWNDTYLFIENPANNADYVLNNIDETIFINLDLDYLIFYAKDGRIVYAACYNRTTESIEPISGKALAYLGKAKNLLEPDDPAPHSGILTTDNTPIIFAVQGVRQTAASGLSNGALLMARDFDGMEVARFRKLISGSLSVLPADSPELPPEVLARLGYGTVANSAVMVTFKDGSGVESYASLLDLDGRSGLILRIQEPKTYLLLAHETFLKIFILVLLLTAFFGLIMYFIIKEFLQRLDQLDAFVLDIRRQGNLSNRITLSGEDEISEIGNQMNRMLDTLEKSQDQLAEAHRSVKEVNRKLNLMTSITRHDIFNRLTVIFGYLDIIKQETDDTKTTALLNKVEEVAESIKKSIEFTTTYQTLGTKEPVWIDLAGILPYSAVPSRVQFDAPLENIEIYADTLVEQVFFNLLDNTVRHGGPVTAIRVTSTMTGDDLVITWEDDGVGVPALEKEKIFKRGYGRNTGLGLFLTREVLSLTGITIRETGEPGKGVRFEITVPKGRFRIV